MRPERLEFIGIKSYSEKAVIDFTALTTDGLFGVFGDTGSGKSTILDAIFYALYGKIPYKANTGMDEFVNVRTGYIAVEFVFSIKENKQTVRYKVKRDYRLKSPSAKTQPPAKAVLSRIVEGLEYPIADSVTTVNDTIEALLGLSLDQFVKCIVLPQGQFSAFLTLPKGDRLKIISALFDLEKYGRYLSMKLSENIRRMQSEADVFKGQLEGYADYSKDALDALISAEAAAKTEYESADVLYLKIAQDFENYKENYVRHNELLKLLADKKLLDEAGARFESKQRLLKYYHRALAAVETYDNLLEKNRAVNALTERKKAVLLRLESIEKKKKELFAQYETLPERKRAAEELRSIYDSLSLLSSERAEADELNAQRDKLLAEYNRKTQEAEKCRGQLAEKKQQLVLIEERISAFDFRSKLTEIFSSVGKLSLASFAKEEAAFLRGLIDRVDADTVALISQRIKTLTEMLDGGDVGEYGDGLTKLKNLLEQNEDYNQRHLSLKDEISVLERKIADYESQLNKIVDDGKALAERIKAFDNKWRALAVKLSLLTGGDVQSRFEFALSAAYNAAKKSGEEISSIKDAYEKSCKDAELCVQEAEHTEENLLAAKSEAASLETLLNEKLGGMTVADAKQTVAAVDDYEVLKAQIDKYNADKTSVENRISQLKETLPDGDYSKERFELLSEEKRTAEITKQDLYKKYIKLQKDRENTSQKYNDRCIIEKAYEKLLDEKLVYDRLNEAVKANKLTEYVADEYLSEICVDAQKTLSKLSSGRYGLEYKGDFYVVDYLNGSEKRKTTTVSGGELFLVSLSLALSLSSSIIAKSNKPIEFFFLDEGFGSLDANLVEIVIDSLEKLRSGNFTIGLISHVEALKERIGAKISVSAPTLTKGSSLLVTV